MSISGCITARIRRVGSHPRPPSSAANTAIFSSVHAVLLRPLPYPDADELVLGFETKPEFERLPLPYLNYLDYRAGQSSFAEFAAMSIQAMTLTGAGGSEPEKLLVESYTHDFLPMLRVQPLLGRNFLPEEDSPGGPRVVLLSHDLWTRRYAADPAMLGAGITLDGAEHTVIGVMPPNYRVLFPASAYVALGARADEPVFRDRAARTEIYAYARLKPGVGIVEARADLQAIGDELGRRFPEAVGASRPLLVPLREDLVRDIRPMLLLLLGAVACVLLIAAANIANLTLERALRRQRELGIRAALGATRWQLVRQMLVESLALAALGGGLGLLLALWSLDLVTALYPPHVTFSIVGPITIDASVLAFTAAVTLGTGVVFGLVPALLASRQDLARALKDADHHASAGGRHLRARDLLVVVEVALAMTLSVGAALATGTLIAMNRVDPGFDAPGLLSAATNLSPDRYPSSGRFMAFWTELERRVAAMPGVTAVAVSSGLPGQLGAYDVVYPMGAARTPDNSFTALLYRVGPGLVETLGIPLLGGRTCGPQDGPGTAPVIVINRALADKFFPGGDAVGQRLQDNLSKQPSLDIVGVVGPIRHDGLGAPERTPYQVYYCYRQLSLEAQSDDALGMVMHIVARTSGPPQELAPQLRAAAAELDPTSPLWGVDTLENTVRQSLDKHLFTARLLAAFAATALLLAALGLHAVMANTVARRTRELGVRMALGAQPRAVVALVLRQGLGLVAVGLALGTLGAYGLNQAMAEILSDEVAVVGSYLGVAALLVGVSLLAMLVPARRATRIDPMVALRHD